MGVHLRALLIFQQGEGGFDQIADNLFDIAADIADFGKLRRFDLEEGRAGEGGEAAADLGFADTRRADHQDVFRRHFPAQIRF